MITLEDLKDFDTWKKWKNGEVSLVDENIDYESVANEEFKNVGDDGLFPNHTDKDIWTSGFVSALKWKNNGTDTKN